MIVWHYTTEEKLNPIYAHGALLPSGIGIGERERPVLWFSSNSKWEPTANKALGVEGIGAVRPMTTREMFRYFKPVRFGFNSDRLLHWQELRKVAKIAHTEQRRLIRRAKRVLSYPHQWYGSLDPIQLEDLTREDYVPGVGWRPNTTDGN